MRTLSIVERLTVERLKALDYSSLKTLEDQMFRCWNTYIETISKFDDLSVPLLQRDMGCNKENLTEISNYYFNAHCLCQKVAKEFEKQIFGPQPELEINLLL
ncbi:MAG: hypothetical protein ACOH2V_07380 [Candidatus Saccharimonadaceae bacterium]